MAPDISRAQSGRRKLVFSGLLRALKMIVLWIPAAIIAIYYLVGWQASVLAFPALWLLFVRKVGTGMGRSRERRKRSITRYAALSVLLAGLTAIPIAAVVLSNAELMRMWAYATAIPMAFMLATDREAANRFTARDVDVPTQWVGVVHGAIWATIAAVFVGGSELIWLNATIEVWIWYHAFAIPIFMIMMVIVYEALKFIVPPAAKAALTKSDPPTAAPDDNSTTTAVVVFQDVAGGGRHFGHVLLSQAQAIWNDIDHAGEFRQLNNREIQVTENAGAGLLVLFMDGGLLRIGPESETTVNIHWHFLGAPSTSQYFGKHKSFDAGNVPIDLVPGVIECAWIDDWNGIKAQLSTYEIPK